MSFLDAFVLGLIQGMTEFLPVSSSGHLVIGQALLGIRIPGVSFEVAVHLATLLSVLLVFRKRVGGLISGALRVDRGAWRYLGLLALATLPAVVVGLGARNVLESLFEAPAVVGGALLVTGSFLWSSRAALGRDPRRMPGIRDAVVMGITQAFSIIPGISRSGATVVAGLWLRVEPEEAATFSFLMAVPAILGAAVLELPDLFAGTGISGSGGVQLGGTGIEGAALPGAALPGSALPAAALPGSALSGWALLVGSLVAAVAGVLAIRTFLGMLKRRSFHRFGPYCLAVGALFLVYLFLV